MAWRIVIQPNGKYARFSDVVDNFTDYDMTREEAFAMCRSDYAMPVKDAEYKIEQAEKNPRRFDREIGTILEVHGEEQAEAVRKELSV